ncbi:MAG: uroporphyrinogen decarboxylase family protein, partial [Planctomycetota bacterium]
FLGEDDFVEWGKPYLERAYNAFDADIRFFHNDSEGTESAPHLSDIGINLFNFSSDHGLSEMRELAGEDVALLGNLPPRDVLAGGSPDDVREGVKEMFADIPDGRVLPSCGGGMPPEVPTENIRAFIEAADECREGSA